MLMKKFRKKERVENMTTKLKIAALVSGSGTNLQAVIDACEKGEINGSIVCVGSDCHNAFGLKRAKKHNIPTFVTDYRHIIRDKDALKNLPEDFDFAKTISLQKLFDKKEKKKTKAFLSARAAAEADLFFGLACFEFDLLILAGFMRLLTPYFIDKVNIDPMKPKIMNIHPALLPAFPGTSGYGDTFRYGAKIGGCTVHFVDYGEDTGPIIGQKAFPILQDDTLETIKKRGLALEWELYPECIGLFEQDRIELIEKNHITDKGLKIKRKIVRISQKK